MTGGGGGPQLVDERSGRVLGNQITPLPVMLDGATHSLSLPLEMIAATATRSSRFTLQLAAESKLYETHPQGGSITFSKVNVALPGVSVRG